MSWPYIPLHTGTDSRRQLAKPAMACPDEWTDAREDGTHEIKGHDAVFCRGRGPTTHTHARGSRSRFFVDARAPGIPDPWPEDRPERKKDEAGCDRPVSAVVAAAPTI